MDFNGDLKGPMDCCEAYVTLERVHRRQSLIDLKPRQRIERAADMKARGKPEPSPPATSPRPSGGTVVASTRRRKISSRTSMRKPFNRDDR